MGFARVAGGESPRKELFERFRNRYTCKFHFTPEYYGLLGCTGCGRCIQTCLGKIDMRKVITRLLEKR